MLELNREDGGERKFILVQQPYEPKKQDNGEQVNIAETITAERVRRVMQGYAYEGNADRNAAGRKNRAEHAQKADELLKRIEEGERRGQNRV